MGQIATRPTTAVATEPHTDLTPARSEQVFSALEALFLAHNTDAVALGTKKVALYVNAASGEPLWAVHEAIERFVSGRVPGVRMAFLPTVPQFASEVRERSRWARERAERKDEEERRRAEQRRMLEEERERRAKPRKSCAEIIAQYAKSKEMPR